ncbi:MAG: rod shape-determining protein MreC [Gemmatimonadetes bacterium]|nr:rod shape-determining protein MreC [Gemmatimonadota bacterium]
MAQTSESYSTRGDTIAFSLCVLIAVAARLAPLAYTDPVASAIRETILAPFLELQNQSELWRVRRSEFTAIMARSDSALAIAGRVQGLEQENARLRAILGLRSRMPVHHVAGEVLHQTQPTRGNKLIISVGEQDGVRRWAPVVAVGGLVGYVQSVDRGTAVIRTWTDPEFSVSVTALNDSVFGLVGPRFGDGRMMLELRGVSYGGRIPEGTVVYTSGLGGVYPRGIPVGRIRAVIDDRVEWSRTYLLEPAVHEASVSHVLLLLAEAGDLSSVFDPS